jgi:phosphate-selective porin OprO/OprP
LNKYTRQVGDHIRLKGCFMETKSTRWYLSCIVSLVAVLASPAAFSQLPDTIILDVYVMQSGGSIDESPVNLIMRDGKLALITKDKITAENSNMLILNGEGGYLVGRLAIGEVPGFIVLSDNPSTNLDVLMDTKSFITFAVRDGEILRNDLHNVVGDPNELANTSPRWLAYQPPPFSIPTSHEAADKWNTFRSRWVNGLFISAVALDRQWISQDASSKEQFGDLSEFERGTIRGWRFGLAGTINFDKPWVYNIAGAWNSFDRGFDNEQNEFEFFDFSVDIPLTTDISVSVGKQKEPINMDRSMTMIQIASQERYAAADAMFPSRNFGVVVNGTVFDQRVSWATGLFNDWLIEGEDLNESSTQAIGRVTWLPYISPDESSLLHVGLGVRYSNAKTGLQYRSRPETGNAPQFVDTEVFDANSSTLYNWELGFRTGRLWLMAEYSDNHVDAPSVGNPRFTGHHISGTWAISREMRPYRKRSGVFGGLPIAQDVEQGGRGAMELAFRYSSVDLTEGLIKGGEMDIATLQLNWWLTKSIAFGLNYRRTWTDVRGLDGEMDAFVGRVMLILQ